MDCRCGHPPVCHEDNYGPCACWKCWGWCPWYEAPPDVPGAPDAKVIPFTPEKRRG